MLFISFHNQPHGGKPWRRGAVGNSPVVELPSVPAERVEVIYRRARESSLLNGKPKDQTNRQVLESEKSTGCFIGNQFHSLRREIPQWKDLDPAKSPAPELSARGPH